MKQLPDHFIERAEFDVRAPSAAHFKRWTAWGAVYTWKR
jgi:hypothetical protein